MFFSNLTCIIFIFVCFDYLYRTVTFIKVSLIENLRNYYRSNILIIYKYAIIGQDPQGSASPHFIFL